LLSWLFQTFAVCFVDNFNSSQWRRPESNPTLVTSVTSVVRQNGNLLVCQPKMAKESRTNWHDDEQCKTMGASDDEEENSIQIRPLNHYFRRSGYGQCQTHKRLCVVLQRRCSFDLLIFRISTIQDVVL
jgi:hypothetical protein